MSDETPAEQIDAALETLPPGGSRQGKPGHDSADSLARGAKAVRYRVAGMTYDQIAQEMEYADKSVARQVVVRALDRHEAEGVRELRELENARLDAGVRALIPLVTGSGVAPGTRIRAVDSLVRLSARRARMNGLDAPVQVALSAGVAADLEDALAEAEAVLVEGQVLASTDDTTEGDET